MYVPSNRVIVDLYTPGNEFVVTQTGLLYTGYYHKLYTGEYFSGRTPQDGTPFLLTRIQSDGPVLSTVAGINATSNVLLTEVNTFETDQEYLDSKSPQPRIMPIYYYPRPTQDDYSIGEITRYFLKRVNFSQFYEIDLDQYTNFTSNNPEYVFELFTPFKLPWNISGDRQSVSDTNKKVTSVVQKTEKVFGFYRYVEMHGGFLNLYK